MRFGLGWMRRLWFGRESANADYEEGWSGELADSGPVYYDPDKESLREFTNRLWSELPEAQREKIVTYILADQEFVDGALADIDKAIKADPEDWVAPYHFGWGMSFRNFLRKCMKDTELPSGNWDDYYVAAVEEAVRRYNADRA